MDTTEFNGMATNSLLSELKEAWKGFMDTMSKDRFAITSSTLSSHPSKTGLQSFYVKGIAENIKCCDPNDVGALKTFDKTRSDIAKMRLSDPPNVPESSKFAKLHFGKSFYCANKLASLLTLQQSSVN